MCELLHPQPPRNWSYKHFSRFELTRSSNSGFHCNQRGFQPFFFLAEVARQIQGLALFFFFFLPLLFFPCLAGGKRNAWLESELVVMWAISSMGRNASMKSRFRPHTRNQRAGKALLAQRAKCRYQPAFGPKNFLLEFLGSCAYSGLILCFSPLLPGCGHAPGALPTATATRHHHLQDGMEFTVPPKEATSDQPFVSVEKTLVHHEETYPFGNRSQQEKK